jgi:hypothetical protein
MKKSLDNIVNYAREKNILNITENTQDRGRNWEQIQIMDQDLPQAIIKGVDSSGAIKKSSFKG